MDYYIGVDLGGTNIKASIYTKNFDLILEKRTLTEASCGSEHVLNRIYLTVMELITEQNLSCSDVLCMGIGIPGSLDLKNGISKLSPNFPLWQDVPVIEWMQTKLNIVTFIDNDARVNLYGEWYFGAGREKNNIVLMTLGTGIGASAIIDGRVIYGATGAAGEIGHMHLFREGRPCNCGGSGCLERYASASGIVQTAREKLQNNSHSILFQWINGDLNKLTAKMLSEAYDLDDPISMETFQEAGELLGYGLVNVIHLYNPELIIVGGGMAAAGERLLDHTRRIAKNHTLKHSGEACDIVIAELGDKAGMLGAAIFASEKLKSTSVSPILPIETR